MLRKVCKALSESSLNHILTIKHLRITVVGENTYGLPRFRGIQGYGMQPIVYRMSKRIESFILSRSNLWDGFSQNHIPEVDLSCCKIYQDNLNYDHASISCAMNKV